MVRLVATDPLRSHRGTCFVTPISMLTALYLALSNCSTHTLPYRALLSPLISFFTSPLVISIVPLTEQLNFRTYVGYRC
jgi:hypothetical protein